MKEFWHTIADDKLDLVDRAVDFLLGEYAAPGADPIWSSEYFRWKLGPDNPAGRGYLSLALVGDRVVGTVSLTRKRLWIGGKEFTGGEVGDSYSAASMRRRGQPAQLVPGDSDPQSYINKSIFGRLASATKQRAEVEGVNLIYGTPNQQAYPGWTKRLKYFELKRCDVRAFIRPTSRLVICVFPKTVAFGGILKGLEQLTLGLLKKTQSSICRRGLAMEKKVPALSEIDELWCQTRNLQGFGMVRDSRYWVHRYLQHPLAKYDIITIRKAERVSGLVITRRFIDSKGRNQLAIMEWMCKDNVSLSWVLSELAGFYHDQDISYYHLYTCEMKEARAAALNLFLRRSKVPVIWADNPHSRRLESDNRKFEIYLGSTDAA